MGVNYNSSTVPPVTLLTTLGTFTGTTITDNVTLQTSLQELETALEAINTIYTADSTITGNRTINTNGNQVTWSNSTRHIITDGTNSWFMNLSSGEVNWGDSSDQITFNVSASPFITLQDATTNTSKLEPEILTISDNSSATLVANTYQTLHENRGGTGYQWHQYTDRFGTHGYYSYEGSPEGNVRADIGSICSDTANAVVYVKTTDSVNTGWTQLGGGDNIYTADGTLGGSRTANMSGNNLTWDNAGRMIWQNGAAYTQINVNTIDVSDGATNGVSIAPNNINVFDGTNVVAFSSGLATFSHPVGAAQFISMVNGPDTIGYHTYQGSPEGVIAADIGSLCHDVNNGALYVKGTDTVNTGWSNISDNIYSSNGTIAATRTVDANNLDVIWDNSRNHTFQNGAVSINFDLGTPTYTQTDGTNTIVLDQQKIEITTAGGPQLWNLYNDGTDSFGFYNSAGSPEGSQTANIGSIDTDTTNGAVYIKKTDTVNTGWAQLATVADFTATPQLLAGSQDDYALPDLTGTLIVDNTSNVQLRGIAAQANGFQLNILNVGTNRVRIQPENANSAAANRFGGVGNKNIENGEMMTVIYNTTLSRWITPWD